MMATKKKPAPAGKVPGKSRGLENLTGGSRKGVPNKSTAALKDMILGALDQCGGVDYLTERANDPRTAAAFLTLVGKVLPLTVQGAKGGPIETVTRIELVGMSKRD